MTCECAIYEARKRIGKQPRGNREGIYVVWSPEAHDLPRQHFHPCTEEDLDTFFDGAEVCCFVDADGQVQS